MEQNKINRKSKGFDHLTWIIMFFGIAAFGAGLYQMISLPTQYGVNLRYQQPTVANGSIKIILGFLFISASIYRWIKRKKLIKDLIEMEKEERKSRRK